MSKSHLCLFKCVWGTSMLPNPPILPLTPPTGTGGASPPRSQAYRASTTCSDLTTHRGSRKQTKYEILIFWIFFAEYKDDQCFQKQLFFDIVNIRDSHAGDTEVAHMPGVTYFEQCGRQAFVQAHILWRQLSDGEHKHVPSSWQPWHWSWQPRSNILREKSFQGGFQLDGFYDSASSLQSFFFFWPSGIYDCLWLVCFTCAPSVD